MPHFRHTAIAILVAISAVLAASPVVAADPVLIVPTTKVDVCVAAELPEGLQAVPAGSLRLVEVDRPEVTVPAQVVGSLAADGSQAKADGRAVAVIPPRDAAGQQRRFRLVGGAEPTAGGGFRWKEIGDKSLGLFEGDKPVLVYNFGVITNDKVPARDSRRSRSSYIHPVYGINGEVLTDVFPKDHYHHHGVFWTWPHVGIEGKEYDLWADKGIAQRFDRWLDRRAGPVCAVLGVENGWFVGDKKVMIERIWLRVYRQAFDQRVVDLEMTFIPQQNPITLRGAEGKSYGGLTVRFAPPSEKDAQITVPSGPAKADLPDTPLAWADFTSRFGAAESASGAAIFVDPAHPNYPPTWLTRHYGAMCVGWPGVHGRTFEPDRPIRLNYRVWIHKSAVETDAIQAAYDAYAAGVKAVWE